MTITSEMDPTKILNTDTGCATIFSEHKNHAEILIESIKDGKKYTVKAHFTGIVSGRIVGRGVYHTGVGKVKVKVLKYPVRYATRSQTWLASSDKIENLIAEAKRQETYDHNFSILGNQSLLEIKNYNPVVIWKVLTDPEYVYKPYHNCMSWARQILYEQLDIDYDITSLDYFVTATPLKLKDK